jgi:hypothetical protein
VNLAALSLLLHRFRAKVHYGGRKSPLNAPFLTNI